jgi:hypothetical protein
MLKPDAVGHEEVSGRDLFVVDAGSVDDAIGPLPSTSKYFVCLLAWDATSASEAQVAALARHLLVSGCVYILCWGSECERVHDIFDAEEAHQRPDGPFAISTWHTHQTLADVLWDSLFTAFPDDAYDEECRSTICLAIQAPNWAAQARQAFSDPRAFSARHLDEDAG